VQNYRLSGMHKRPELNYRRRGHGGITFTSGVEEMSLQN